MGEPAYSYVTHLNIKFDPLKLIDVSSLAKDVTDKWYNQTLCKVNDSVVRLGVMQGEYHWHKHDNDDEFFFVLSGKFIVDLEDRSIELLPNQGFVVPKGVMHCTSPGKERHFDGRNGCNHTDWRHLSTVPDLGMILTCRCPTRVRCRGIRHGRLNFAVMHNSYYHLT